MVASVLLAVTAALPAVAASTPTSASQADDIGSVAVTTSTDEPTFSATPTESSTPTVGTDDIGWG